MIELIFVYNVIAEYEQEADRRFREQLKLANPERAKIMLEQRERERLERIAERKHRQTIEALERIERAIQNRSCHL